MGKLDFSALNKLAYKDFEEPRADEERRTEQPFTVIRNDKGEAPKTPQTAPERRSEPRASNTMGRASGAPRSAPGRKEEAFMNVSGTRNYKTIYRVAHDFHKRHSPPTLDDEYWDHTSDDMVQTSKAYNDDPFLMSLLIVIMEELEREYTALLEASESASARGCKT